MSEDGAWVLGVDGILTEDETYPILKVQISFSIVYCYILLGFLQNR